MNTRLKTIAKELEIDAMARLGHGAYGETWRARCYGEKRSTLCLKLWGDGHEKSQETHDDALVRAQQFGLSAWMPRLVDSRPGASLMELRPGVELDKWLRTAYRAERLDVIRRIVAAVEAMDNAGFLHGDISVHNVLVARGNVISILDPHPESLMSNASGITELAIVAMRRRRRAK